MSLFISTFLYFFQVASFVVGVLLLFALGLALLLIQSLNQIISVTDEYEIPESLDSDSFMNLSFPASFSATKGSENTMPTTSYFRSN